MFSKTVSGTLLIAGTTIGAGMLGIPLITAKAGFFPAVAISIAVWLFMLATGYLFLEATLWMQDGANVLSISRRFLGKWGKLGAGLTFLFLYYCLMVAYFAAGAPIFLSFLKQGLGLAPTGTIGYLVYGIVFGGIVAAGIKMVDRINYLLMIAMFLSYFLLVGAGAPLVRIERFGHANWNEALLALPILFSAFGFHNVIPSLVTYFDRNVKVLRRSIFFGTAIPLLIYLIWQWLILGTLPVSSIEGALEKGAPATEALQALTNYPWVVEMGQFFALFAILTSMLGVAFSMVDFMGDGLKWKRTGLSRIFLCILIFLPPFFLSSLDPSIFVLAISFAGGFGEALLNGILPVAIVWIGRYHKGLERSRQLFGEKRMLLVLLASSLFVMFLEVIFLSIS